MKAKRIVHIKGHPDVYVGLCGVRQEGADDDVGFVMAPQPNACETCCAKHSDPGYQARQRGRWMGLKKREHERKQLAMAGHKSFSVSDGAYS